MNTTTIDIGCRFEPSDEVLINYYLLPKIMGCPLPPNWILERDVYAAPPWIVFADVADSSPFWHRDRLSNGAKKSIYVFTKVAKKTANSTRISRKAGYGTWSGSTGPNMIRQSADGLVVGYSKMLTFETPERLDPRLGHWIMHEYSLSGRRSNSIDDVVLCKITKGVKKPHRRRVVPTKKRPRPAPADQEGSVNNQAAQVDHKYCDELLEMQQQHQENGLVDDIGIGSSFDDLINLDDIFLSDDSSYPQSQLVNKPYNCGDPQSLCKIRVPAESMNEGPRPRPADQEGSVNQAALVDHKSCDESMEMQQHQENGLVDGIGIGLIFDELDDLRRAGSYSLQLPLPQSFCEIRFPADESTKKGPSPRPADEEGLGNTAAEVDCMKHDHKPCATTTTVESLYQQMGLDYFGLLSDDNGMLDDRFLFDDSYSQLDHNLDSNL